MHSGDSACAIPPPTLPAAGDRACSSATPRAIADALDVRGLVNVQYAVKQGQVFVIEANPRASRTVPFVAKATGVPLAKVAARVMLGATLAELRAEGLLTEPVKGGHVAVKEAVLPFNRFPEVDTVLGPEMRSTGEVMGIDASFGLAFAKSQTAAGNPLPVGRHGVLLAGRPRQGRRRCPRPAAWPSWASRSWPPPARPRHLAAPRRARRHRWCRSWAKAASTPCSSSSSGKVDLVVNTPRGRGPRADGYQIRRAANVHKVSCLTTVAAALAAATSLAERAAHPLSVRSLQEFHAGRDDDQPRLL